MTPSIDGTTYHFESRGLYDGVSILWDEETGSIWHHVTGEALAGPLRGKSMPIFNLLQMTARKAIAAYPDLAVAISDRPIRGGGVQRSVDREFELNEGFRETMATEDTRRPTMEIGIGVWNDGARRYYPVSAIREAGRVVLDDLGAKRVAVYLEPGTGVPLAFYTDAVSAAWDGDVLRFDDGTAIRDGILYEEDGDRVEVQRPLQLFTRWYGWALMYPDTEIWGGQAPPRPNRRSLARGTAG